MRGRPYARFIPLRIKTYLGDSRAKASPFVHMLAAATCKRFTIQCSVYALIPRLTLSCPPGAAAAAAALCILLWLVRSGHLLRISSQESFYFCRVEGVVWRCLGRSLGSGTRALAASIAGLPTLVRALRPEICGRLRRLLRWVRLLGWG